MRELSPQLKPDFELDAVSFTLLRPPSWFHSRRLQAGLFLAVALVLTALFVSGYLLLGLPVLALYGAVVLLLRFLGARNPQEVELTVRRGRLEIDLVRARHRTPEAG